MKRAFVTFAFLLFTFPALTHGQSTNLVTFEVDVSYELGYINPGETIGVRGDTAPLSWSSTTPMEDPETDNIFTVTIDFSSVAAGTEIQYKFVHEDPATSQVIWELPLSTGWWANRSFILAGGDQTLPVVYWDDIDQTFMLPRYDVYTTHSSDGYGFGAWADAVDSLGLSHIDEVKISTPLGTESLLPSEAPSNPKRFSRHFVLGTTPPELGLYTFTATNLTPLTLSAQEEITNFVEQVPTIIYPANGQFISEAQPVLDWEDVSDPHSQISYSVNVHRQNNGQWIWGVGGLSASEVQFNFDGTANETLQEGISYNWSVHANDESGNTSEWWASFIYSSSSSPVITAFDLNTGHDRWGNYYINSWADVVDPQGLGDIQTVKVIDANGFEFTLNYEGSGNRYSFGNYNYGSTPPPLGETRIVALDQAANADTVSENLNNVVEEIPTGIYPADNGLITETMPTFDWQDVSDPQSQITYSIYVDRHDTGQNIWNANNLTSSTAVFNFNGTASDDLQDGMSYNWNVNANDEFGNSSWWGGKFAISTGDGPVIVNFDLWTNHDQGGYRIDAWADVVDPQGQSDISTVKVIDAVNNEFLLSYQGDNHYSGGAANMPDPPPLGETYIVALDQAANTDTVSENLTNFVEELPTGIYPPNAGVITETVPTFDWQDVTDPQSSITYSIYVDRRDTGQNIWAGENLTSSMAVFNFNSMASEDLQDGTSYNWNVTARDDYGNAAWWGSYFTVSTGDGPVIVNFDLWTNHNRWGDYNIGGWADVVDPQGLGDVQTVKVIDANGFEFTLNYEGSGNRYSGGHSYGSTPPLGETRIVALDQSANADTVSENLNNVVEEIPTAIYPADNGLITETVPTFDWQDVSDPQSSITYSVNVHRQDNGQHIWGVGGLTSSQVAYNFNGTASENLQDGMSYNWNVSANDNFGNNAHWDGNFAVSTGDGPVIVNFDLWTNHDQGGYRIDAWADVIDPQGQSDISTVKVIDAADNEFLLNYQGGNHYSGGASNMPDPPPLGISRIVALDQSANTDTVSENLTNFIEEIPTGIYPANGAYITETEPLFDWQDVTDPQSNISYNINVHRQDNGQHIWGFGGLSSSQAQYNFDGTASENLQIGLTYEWNVGANDDFGNSSWWGGSFTIVATVPEVTIRDIQFVPDEQLVNQQDASPLLDQPVIVRGVVIVPPGFSSSVPAGQSKTFIMDVSQGNDWSGINVITLSPGSADLIAGLSMGDTVEIAGKVTEFNTFTEVVPFQTATIISSGSPPDPIAINPADLGGTNIDPQDYLTGEKWEGVLVEINNVTVVNNHFDDNSGWVVEDAAGNQVLIAADSDSMRTANDSRGPGTIQDPNALFVIPPVGAHIDKIVGIIDARWGSYSVNPRFPHIDLQGSPAIGVNSPNGGENWPVGSFKNITWSWLGDIANVKIEYSTDNGVIWNVIAESTENDGVYSWQVPNEPTGEALVRISDAANGNLSDVSDGPFTILGDIVFSDAGFSASVFYFDMPAPDGIAELSGNSLLVVNEFGGPGPAVFQANEGATFSEQDAFSTIGDPFNNPDDIVRLADGTVFVADGQAQTVFKIAASGGAPEPFVTVATTGSGSFSPFGIAIAPPGFDGLNVDPGDLVIADNGFDGVEKGVWAVNPNTGNAKIIAQGNVFVDGPLNPVFASDGTLFIFENFDSGSGRIVKLSAEGVVTPFLDNLEARSSLAIHPGTDDLFFKKIEGDIYRVPKNGGTPLLFASSLGWYQDIVFSNDGTAFYVSAVDRKQVLKITGPFSELLPPRTKWYVSTSGNNGNDGSPENPFRTIQHAVDFIAGGDTILVAAGIYSENLQVTSKDIKLLGGYEDTNWSRDITANETILDGSAVSPTVSLSQSSILFEGFIVQNGQAPDQGGGGIDMEGGAPIVRYCTVRNNQANGVDEWGGGGIHVKGGTTAQILSCVVIDNHSPGGAGGIRAGGADILIRNTIFARNSGRVAIHFNETTGSIINSTITGNPEGGFLFNQSPIAVLNCIEWQNNTGNSGDLNHITYSDIEGGAEGEGNIDVNPLFADVGNNDYRLQLDSPCIDAGHPDASHNDVNGTRNDMGAFGGPAGESYTYEDGPPVVENVVVNPAIVFPGNDVTITAYVWDAQTTVSSVLSEIESPDENVVATLELYDDGLHDDGAAGDSTYGNSWTASSSVGSYYVDIIAVDDQSHTATYNNVGSFLVPPITVTAPNGGEIWEVGSQQNITWTSSEVANLKIQFTTDNGASWIEITPSTPASTGTYAWTVPPALSALCRVRITDADDPAAEDMSDNVFTIYAPATLFTPTANNLGITTTAGQFGCAWGDYDSDGDLDLFIPGQNAPNALYRNDGGTQFIDVSAEAGLAVGDATGAIWADFDGDSDLDLLATDNGLRLYRNDGSAFTDISTESNLHTIDPGLFLMQTTVGDYDQDSDLDIALAGAGGAALPTRILNNEGGVFTNVADAVIGFELALECWNPSWVDVDNDGDLDLWMPTIRTPGQGCALLINQGGQFVLSDPGVTGLAAASAIASTWGDFDNDGDMDLFLVPFSGDAAGNAKLYQNNGDGTFVDITPAALNLAFADSRGVYWGDYDNDGDQDLLIGGLSRSAQKLYRNDDGTFVEAGAQTGAGVLGSFRSVVLVDYDNDGSLDLYYNEGAASSAGGSPSKLLLHNGGSSNHWVVIKPEGATKNTAAIGARITAVTGSLRQVRDIQGGAGGITNGYLWAHFGLGEAAIVDSIIVKWPTGITQVLTDIAVDQFLTITESFSTWLTPVSIQGSGSQFDLAFGGHPNATDGVDQNLDVVTTPPGQNYYAYFSIAPPVSFLATDYRGWVAPFDAPRTWTLEVVNAGGVTSEISWNPVDLPPEGSFKLEAAQPGINLDMRQQSSVQFTGNATLLVQYLPLRCVTYDFNVQGGAWYLISLPVVPADNAVNTLFPGAAGAFGWNYTSQSYVPVTHLEPEKAYWLLMLQATTVEVCGEPFETYTHNYTTPGWDLTGSVLETSSLVDDPDQSVLAMFSWDAALGQYLNISPFTVEPKGGYWILVFNTPSSVTVGGAITAAATAKAGTSADLAAFYGQYGTLPPSPPYELAGNKFAPLPASYGLSQNYPNPFNPETVIEYQLPQSGRVSLTVYDMLGREVRKLVDQEMPAGFHKVRWNGRNDIGERVESGMYIVRIGVGEFIAVRKLLLVK